MNQTDIESNIDLHWNCMNLVIGWVEVSLISIRIWIEWNWKLFAMNVELHRIEIEYFRVASKWIGFQVPWDGFVYLKFRIYNLGLMVRIHLAGVALG